ncbi:protein ETHYLENE-INSENSITIVE 2-like isoform X2 [Zingiber officinale]|uniref:protein ETHYLENE-INSENSITIVE 2-like isoform X2 n=1 Tax=Zingiber officinale TaxID=94328 RepID=UPI001C4CC5ED|nr:protein ETHYLENE-INSENSITIVE 2-like isoform X2 [Zingiber officinale]
MSMASFPALGPAFVISMGYVDLGKWLAAVDGGVRFGNDLMLLVLFFNFTAILCQYLATCVGIVTEKNLAEICRDEYSGTTCMILGVQAELSLIISDLTMILGVAQGFNLLFGVDLFACAWSAAAGSIILPLLTHPLMQNDRKAGLMCEIISGMALVFYVLGVLISQPEIPLAKNIMFPKLSGESAYSLMALLGANIMVHNFYVHSSVVQQQKRFLNVPVGALLHEHFFGIMFIFTGISLVNYVLMNSAASVFGSTDIDLNFHDVCLLMDQIFRIPIAPIAVLLLLFSSQIGALAWNTDGPQILHYSFGANVSVWVRRLLLKTSSVIPALCCAKIGGTEGIYKFLIFCQVIQAMLLPSSAIPLFRVASSRSIMGEYKMAWYLDIMSLLAFLLMLASNIFFINEMLFGNSISINSLKENTRFGGTITYAAILLVACASILFTLYLAATPLKSASDFPDLGTLVSLKDELPEETEDTTSIRDEIKATENQLSLEPLAENTLQYTDISFSESILEQSDAAMDSDNDPCQIIDSTAASNTTFDSDHDCHQHIHFSGSSNTFIAPIFQPEVSKSIDVEDLESVSGTSTNTLLDTAIKEKHEFETDKEDLALEVAIATVMEKDETLDTKDSVGELLVPISESLPHLTSEDSECCNAATVKISEESTGSVNLSKLSGLGRATRRQFAAILDEFWGQFFDFHGKPTPEAVGQKYDSLLGLDSKGVRSAKGDIGTEPSINFHKDVDRITIFPPNPMEYNSHKMKISASGDLSYGSQVGSSTWSRNLQAKTHFLNSAGNLPEPNERRYSSLYLPQYSDNHDYQPATIHGYQIASYLKEIGATRNPFSSNVAPESPRVTKSSLKVPPGFGDSVPYSDRQTGLNSLAPSSLQSPTASRVSRMQVEGNYFNPSLVEPIGNADTSAYEKKYHSSPDISALIAASRNYYLNESKLGGPIGSRPSVSRMMTSQQHQYLNPISRTAVSSPFNEFYPPNLQRDALPPQSNLSSGSKSLWSMQPYEQFFGTPTREYNLGGRTVPDKPGSASQEVFPCAEVERRLLQSLRSCILKLLKLENSDWLFRLNDGCDEELIYQVATTEKNMCKVVEMNHLDSSELRHLSPERKLNSVQRNEEADISCTLSLPNCGDGCIWRTSLLVSFGVWCIHRILDLSLVESRPELWGKYTYVLNRLQGILDLAFSKPRSTLNTCSCLDVPLEVAEPSDSLMLSKMISGSFTTAAMILDIIKEVEISVSGRKGRTGTAAGDVAFPKGKENLASVLKRYKRRLSNKSAGAQEVSLPRKIHTAPVL